MHSDAERRRALLEAQAKASELFDSATPLIVPGVTELELSRSILELARRDFGTDRFWHKRIVRAGANTLSPYDDDPPNRTIGEDDIVFIDLGPVFEAWEADFGRTFVLGHDPVKRRLRDDAAAAFADGKAHFERNPQITGAELFAFAGDRARACGWEFGGAIAGHLVGEFPHKRLPENAASYMTPDHRTPLRGLDSLGRERHWILEIHFVDRDRSIGAFHEELLTIG